MLERVGLKALLAVAVLCGPTCSIAGQAADERASQAFISVAESAAPMLVQLRYYGGGASDEPLAQVTRASGLSLGAGWLLTSDYGLEPKPNAVVAVFDSGFQAKAQIVGRDENRRLVLLRAEQAPEAPFTLGDAGEARVGQWAIALGAVIDQRTPHVSVGVVSAVGRVSGRALQTDAMVSPLNYGGPLLDVEGRLLGVLVPLTPAGQGVKDWYDSGIGFAVPWSEVTDRLERLKRGETIQPGRLGVVFDVVENRYTSPAVAIEVVDGGAAESAGIAPGDRVVRVDGVPTPTLALLMHRLGDRDARDRVVFGVERGDRLIEIATTLKASTKKSGGPQEDRRIE